VARAFDIAVAGGALVDIDRSLMGSCRPEAVRLLRTTDPSLTTGSGFLSPVWFARLQHCASVVAMVKNGKG
jgi:hypothetical protein